MATLGPYGYLKKRKQVPRPKDKDRAKRPATSSSAHGRPPGAYGDGAYVGHKAVFSRMAFGGRAKVSGGG